MTTGRHGSTGDGLQSVNARSAAWECVLLEKAVQGSVTNQSPLRLSSVCRFARQRSTLPAAQRRSDSTSRARLDCIDLISCAPRATRRREGEEGAREKLCVTEMRGACKRVALTFAEDRGRTRRGHTRRAPSRHVCRKEALVTSLCQGMRRCRGGECIAGSARKRVGSGAP